MSVQDQDQEEIIDFLETESAGFADQEEEGTVEDQETIVEQEESRFSEVEEKYATALSMGITYQSKCVIRIKISIIHC